MFCFKQSWLNAIWRDVLVIFSLVDRYLWTNCLVSASNVVDNGKESFVTKMQPFCKLLWISMLAHQQVSMCKPLIKYHQYGLSEQKVQSCTLADCITQSFTPRLGPSIPTLELMTGKMFPGLTSLISNCIERMDVYRYGDNLMNPWTLHVKLVEAL